MEELPTLPNLDELKALFEQVTGFVAENLLLVSSLVQVAIICVAFVAAWALAKPFRRLLNRAEDLPKVGPFLKRVALELSNVAVPLIWLILQWMSVGAAQSQGLVTGGLEAVVSLLTAWIVIRLATAFMEDRAKARMVATVAWTVAALNILGLLGPLAELLDGYALTLGDFRLSVWGVLKGFAILAVLLWLAGLTARLLENRLTASKALTPSLKVLFGKIGRITLFSIAGLMALEAVGIDLTALAVFSGAVGLGIGFGLQKVFSNLISGVILLLDRSVKPGDVIVIGETYGWINKLGGRYVSVITRDGTEHLIPNEELIASRVENWSHSDNLVRIKLPMGVDYGSDLRQAIQLTKEAASRVDRVLSTPPPVCNVLGFGDSAVDLELRIWIQDPSNGVGNVKSQVYLEIWDAFHENGVGFPYPQRDLNIKGSVPVHLTEPKPQEG